ncbi:thiosulfate sulfurtransferase-like [Pelobates fuscus]|uniref:thiosulfate sulfurtransferase-like n=1 Tax=Pelobates fuscus TaxID=191477 RepID=UPI002FE4E983
MVQQIFCRALVSASWLSGAIKTRPLGAALRVVDSTWYAPGGKDARKDFAEKHIQGASFFDMDQCSEKSSPYEMMLPSESQFAKYVGSLGINNQSHVVVYDCDSAGMMYAPRVWWMFRLFGHNKVSVLDGGLKNWLKQGLPVTAEVTEFKPQTFQTKLNRCLLKTFEDIQENLSSTKFQLVDARGEARFRGPEPKPGEGIGPGHIPGSLNLPFSSLLTKDGCEKPVDEIRKLFQEKGVDLTKPLTATCHRGVTACHLALAAFVTGKQDVAVYDGSWSEWFHRAGPEHKVYEKKGTKA